MKRNIVVAMLACLGSSLTVSASNYAELSDLRERRITLRLKPGTNICSFNSENHVRFAPRTVRDFYAMSFFGDPYGLITSLKAKPEVLSIYEDKPVPGKLCSASALGSEKIR